MHLVRFAKLRDNFSAEGLEKIKSCWWCACPFHLRRSKTTVLVSERGRIPKRLALAGCGYKRPECICDLQRVRWDWLRFLCLCAIGLTATTAPCASLWKVRGAPYRAWLNCTTLCSALPKRTGKYVSGKHHECMRWHGKKIIIKWTGRLSWFLGHESNKNRITERRNLPRRQPNPQLPGVGFLATSFEAACAGHCRRRTVESTVTRPICYGYSCIPGTIQENET